MEFVAKEASDWLCLVWQSFCCNPTK